MKDTERVRDIVCARALGVRVPSRFSPKNKFHHPVADTQQSALDNDIEEQVNIGATEECVYFLPKVHNFFHSPVCTPPTK